LTVYLIVFGILAMVVLLMELPLTQSARLALLAVAYVLLVALVGLRWETGNDWPNYYNYYLHLNTLDDSAHDFEIGYRLFSLLIKSTGLPFWGFNFIYAAIYLGLFFSQLQA